jgi:hypothetical protein
LAPQAWWRLVSGKALDGFEPPPSPAQLLEGARFVPREPLAVDIGRRKGSLAALREIQALRRFSTVEKDG